MMKQHTDICVLTTYHEPDDDRVFQKELRSLVRAGYAACLVAPAEQSEFQLEGIPVRGVRRRRLVGRLLTVASIGRLALRSRSRVYHLHEPELLLLIPVLKGFTGAKIIYDVHEDHATSIPARVPVAWIRWLVGRMIRAVEWVFARFADEIIVVRPDLTRRFTAYGCPRITEVMVCVQRSLFPERRADTDTSRSPVIVHEGNLDIATRGLDKYLQAAVTVIREYPNAKFYVIGRAPAGDVEWMQQFIREHALDANVEFTGWVPFEHIPEYLAGADIGILLLQPVSENNRMGIPNKLFDYMAASLPVVACDFPNVGQIVRSTRSGILVDPTDPGQIATAILDLLKQPDRARTLGRNGREAFEQTYNWEMMEKRLLAIYARLVGAPDAQSGTPIHHPIDSNPTRYAP